MKVITCGNCYWLAKCDKGNAMQMKHAPYGAMIFTSFQDTETLVNYINEVNECKAYEPKPEKKTLTSIIKSLIHETKGGK